MDEVSYWFNPRFLQVTVLIDAQQLFARNSPQSIQLQNMLHPARIVEIRKELEKVKWRENVKYDQYQYKVAVMPLTLKRFFASPAVKKMLSVITGLQIKKIKGEWCVFGPGDYTVMQDKIVAQKGVFFELDFTDFWQQAWGGYTSFVDKEEKLRVLPGWNQLTLVKEAKNMQHFVKYVNHRAKNKRMMVRGIVL
ncbi:MAG: 2OG-Fe(II) oxygenase family protein [Nanoarchaeota archaeon]|nr:2OG-Fe(II) oxygenase family protein [Nanoarchaeota archaeon]